MELATDDLQRFVGGQIEIQNPTEGYLHRGEIATIAVENPSDPRKSHSSYKSLVVTMRWCATGDGYPPLPERWVNNEDLDYRIDLMFLTLVEGASVDGRLVFGPTSRQILTEIVVLFPPGGSRLDPARVEGLVLEPTLDDPATD